MITLLTGAPRSGKTLYTVDKLITPEIGRSLEIDDDKKGKHAVVRRVLSNINQLQLEHELIDHDWLVGLKDNVKPADFIVFDEVQRVWPNRPTGAKIPPSVEYLQTHGHDAVDLVIMTQSPMLIDPGVRALVGRHLHVRKVGGFGAAIIYEWDGCSNSLNFKNAFKKTGYKYSSKARHLYKSAKGHTGSRASLPVALWFVLAGLVGSAFAWPHLVKKITGGVDVVSSATAKPGANSLISPANASPSLPGTVAAAPVRTFRDLMRERDEYFLQSRPRDLAHPHTAPKYDALTQPVVVPYAAICVASTKECRCYTTQVTRLDVPDEVCRSNVDRGYFVDFIQPKQEPAHAPKAPTAEPVEPRSVAPIQLTTQPRDVDVLAWMKSR
ncbi:MAG: hypothetical protein CVU22_06290 [Betaproteobacteria bacterium HGW-Betaproteobacteria-16]|nr:MAG: hypothetical protein CVU22_06290 [Betaproteobacteria bacterium HGW-Betaproteobacteria-16]